MVVNERSGEMIYHTVTLDDCLSIAGKKDKLRLLMIRDLDLLKRLALKWCDQNGYKLGNYIGKDRWDASSIK